MGSQVVQDIKICVSHGDRGDLRSLQRWIQAGSNTNISLSEGNAKPGELGSTAVLVMTSTSGILIAAIRVLPDFIRSRKSSVSFRVFVKGKPFEVHADNAEDAVALIAKVLGDDDK